MRGCRLVVFGALLAGCAKREPPPPPPAATTAISTAVDRLLPGELAEGGERALGLVLPRDVHVERAFDDSVVARGHVGAEALANYVRRRVDAARVEIGAARTLFTRAHVKGQPDTQSVRIEVVREFDTT